MYVTPSFAVDWWRRPEPASRVEVDRHKTTAAAPDDTRPRLAFRALLGLTIVLLAAPQEFVPALAPFRIVLIAASIATATHLLSRLSEESRVRARTPEGVIVACLFGWAVVTIPASMWPGGSVQTLTELYIKSVVAFWLLGAIVDTPTRLRTLFWTLSLLVLPLSLTALRHFGAGTMSGGRIAGYGGGLTGNPNDLALMLNIIAPLTASLALTAKRPAARVLAAGLAALAAATVIVTFSRGGFVTMVLTGSLFVLLLIKRRTWVPVVLLAAVLLCAAPLLPSGYVDRIQTVFSIESDPTGSSQERWRDTVAAVEFVRSHPIVGAGLGMDILALNDVRGAYWVHVHDAYLNYAVDLGIPGLLLFSALLITSLRGVRSTERHVERADPDLAVLAAGVRIGLCGYALAAFFYPTAYQFYFYYLVGIAVAVRRIGASTSSVREHATAA